MKRFFYITLAIIGMTGIMALAGPHNTAMAASGGAGSGSPLTGGSSPKSAVCGGVGAANGSNGCTGSGPSVNDLISTIINILSIIAGIAAVIMVIVSGLRYITAGGDSGKVSGAKSTLTYALVGAVIAVSAQAIVQFVLSKSGV